MKSLICLHNNYIEPKKLISRFISSEQSPFLYENTQDFTRRKKTWRTRGFWKIDESNNKIVFQEVDGVNLTAEILIGEYQSTSALCAAIKTALELPGASTYTISQDSETKKIKFQSSGAFFKLMTTHVDMSGFCDLAGFSKTNDKTGALIYKTDTLKIHQEEFVIWDFGVETKIKAFVLCGSRNSSLNFSSSAKIYLQANNFNIWNSPPLNIELKNSIHQIALIDQNGIGVYRYWRLKIVDPNNVFGFLEINKLYLGDAYAPKRGAVQFPFQIENIDRSNTQISESGQVFSDKKEKTVKFNFDWAFLTKEEKEYIELIFNKFGKTNPTFFSIDTKQAFSSEYQDQIRLCYFAKEPNVRLESPNNFDMSTELLEAI